MKNLYERLQDAYTSPYRVEIGNPVFAPPSRRESAFILNLRGAYEAHQELIGAVSYEQRRSNVYHHTYTQLRNAMASAELDMATDQQEIEP